MSNIVSPNLVAFLKRKNWLEIQLGRTGLALSHLIMKTSAAWKRLSGVDKLIDLTLRLLDQTLPLETELNQSDLNEKDWRVMKKLLSAETASWGVAD